MYLSRLVAQNYTGGRGFWMDSPRLLWMTRGSRLSLDLPSRLIQPSSDLSRSDEVYRLTLCPGDIRSCDLLLCLIFQLSSSDLDPMLARLPLSLRLLTTIGWVANQTQQLVLPKVCMYRLLSMDLLLVSPAMHSLTDT